MVCGPEPFPGGRSRPCQPAESAPILRLGPGRTGEYALYYTFLWQRRADPAAADGGPGVAELYAVDAADAVYLSTGYSVWDAAAFADFEPAKVFRPSAARVAAGWGYFIVVQSRSGVEPAAVWDKVWPFLSSDGGGGGHGSGHDAGHGAGHGG